MLMASRLMYGLAKQHVLPKPLAAVLPRRRTPWVAVVFSTLIAIGLIMFVNLSGAKSIVGALGGTTALLLLCVFAVVNVAVLILRREKTPKGAFRAPTLIPVLGAVTCLFLAGPWARSVENYIQYQIAGALLIIGILLGVVNWFFVHRGGQKVEAFDDIEHLED